MTVHPQGELVIICGSQMQRSCEYTGIRRCCCPVDCCEAPVQHHAKVLILSACRYTCVCQDMLVQFKWCPCCRPTKFDPEWREMKYVRYCDVYCGLSSAWIKQFHCICSSGVEFLNGCAVRDHLFFSPLPELVVYGNRKGCPNICTVPNKAKVFVVVVRSSSSHCVHSYRVEDLNERGPWSH
jgi:hypothetical protein